MTGSTADEGSISREAALAIEVLRHRRHDPDYDPRNHQQRRDELEHLASLYPLPGDIDVGMVDADGVPATWLIPPDADRGVLLYFHGGGYTRGSVTSHQELVARIARAIRCRALVVGYRLAPEHPFPAAVDDAATSYSWLVHHAGIEPSSVVVAGDSAGGGLSVALLVERRDADEPLPAGAVLLSPWTDLRPAAAGAIGPGWEHDPVVAQVDFEVSVQAYLGSRDPGDPLASPQSADLKGLPPMLVLVGGRELLVADAQALTASAISAGVHCELDIAPGMFHVWPLFADLPEAAEAVTRIAKFADDVLD